MVDFHVRCRCGHSGVYFIACSKHSLNLTSQRLDAVIIGLDPKPCLLIRDRLINMLLLFVSLLLLLLVLLYISIYYYVTCQ